MQNVCLLAPIMCHRSMVTSVGGTADFCGEDFASGEYAIRKIVGVAKRQEDWS